MVQVPNLALTWNDTDNSVPSNIFLSPLGGRRRDSPVQPGAPQELGGEHPTQRPRLLSNHADRPHKLPTAIQGQFINFRSFPVTVLKGK
jgi:hypothetical protein